MKCPYCNDKLYIPKKTTTDNKRPMSTYTFVVCLNCRNKYLIQ